MADFVGWIGDFLELPIATIGTTSVTLGLMVAGGLISAFAVSVAKRLKGR